jgi:dynein heavy chain 1
VEPLRKRTEEEKEAAEECAQKQNENLKECEKAVEAANPILEKARKALNQIKKTQIDEIRSLQNPPTQVRTVLHAICVMTQRPVEKTPSKENPKIIIENWWYTA